MDDTGRKGAEAMQRRETVQARPRAVLGCMTFGRQVDEAEADRMIGLFFDAGHREMDTAHIYGEGRAEEILGRLLSPERCAGVVLATKAHPGEGGGGLAPRRLREQLHLSLRRLRRDRVDIFYLHAPDTATPIETTLEECGRLHREGVFGDLGLSNYPAWEVAHIRHMAPDLGAPAPRLYQGMYNAVTRDVERELFPCLRRLEQRFYAYNPLAGGLLTGRYRRVEDLPEQGRFHEFGFYKDRYWKDAYFRAVCGAQEVCQAEGVAMTEAALRWLIHHSAMAGYGSDAVILGASTCMHLRENLAAYAAGPLPDAIVRAFDEAWEVARPACPKYFRP